MSEKERKKKFVRYEEACELYSMGLTKLKEIARQADAVYKLDRLVLLSVEKMDAYIETFHDSRV